MMAHSYKLGHHPGATWRKTDLQVHTPRDPNWNGPPNLPGGSEAAAQARSEWAMQLLEACKQRGIGAIAITDHHDFCMAKVISQVAAAMAEYEDIWVFPGVEVTCDDSAQCLVLFDPNSDEQDWRRLFGKLNKIAEPSNAASKAPQAQPCGKDLSHLIDEISGDDFLGSRTIILPHAGADAAHKTIVRRGFHPRFNSLPVAGVYIETPFDRLDGPVKERIYGRVPD